MNLDETGIRMHQVAGKGMLVNAAIVEKRKAASLTPDVSGAMLRGSFSHVTLICDDGEAQKLFATYIDREQTHGDGTTATNTICDHAWKRLAAQTTHSLDDESPRDTSALRAQEEFGALHEHASDLLHSRCLPGTWCEALSEIGPK